MLLLHGICCQNHCIRLLAESQRGVSLGGRATEKGAQLPSHSQVQAQKGLTLFAFLDYPLKQRAQTTGRPTPIRPCPCWSVGMVHMEDGRDSHVEDAQKHVCVMCGYAPHSVQWGCAGSKAGDSSGAVALTRKLLSLGLVARLRPRRMLSFLSDTLDRVTLPGTESRCSATTSVVCPLPRACCKESLEVSPYPLARLEGSTDLP